MGELCCAACELAIIGAALEEVIVGVLEYRRRCRLAQNYLDFGWKAVC